VAWGRTLAVLAVVGSSAACAAKAAGRSDDPADALRNDAVRRAQVWSATNVASMNLRLGPQGKGAFAPNAVVECQYVKKDMSGATPKFTCKLPDGDEVKVKYGRDNGEVYAEVAATRLLWALGFGADHMYPVRVKCKGCPLDDAEVALSANDTYFEAAAIERKMPGHEIEDSRGPGWSWVELDSVDPERGGAPRAHRDALKLLAVMLQHSDSKREQQRLICLSPGAPRARCARSFMLISDLGRTFGKATLSNADRPSSVNLKAWDDVPIWQDPTGCRAHMSKSFSGTLENPLISEPGRRFLAGLLARLSDRQLRDLFTVARFPMRADAPQGEEAAEVDAWVTAFKKKVSQISSRQCGAPAVAAVAP
jgi:hypothetical protein